MTACADAHPDPPHRVAIRPLDVAAIDAARARQRQLLKPVGALGRLEELAVWLAGATGRERPQVIPRVVVAAADHGVAAQERVSAYPPAVTGQMLGAFLARQGAVTALAGEVGAGLVLVDAGVAPGSAPDHQQLVRTGLRPSANLAKEPALTAGEVAVAVDCGRELAAAAAADGVTVLVGGEMGIGNTTPATCLTAGLTGADGPELAGPGTGLDQAGLAHKRDVVRRAMALHRPHAHGPLGWLRRVGGGEIAVLTGLALGAGEQGLAYVCDGLIATAAAAVAVAMEPELQPRLLAGHRSPEPAHTALLDHLGLDPVLELNMRLGEGSGAVTALAILRLACAAHDGMATFAEAGVSGRDG
ncbi:MAG: nicotinate-nucleotide--dimethylbenzimidazole phosphoribosyltransferase [Solirubrobacteraceae bacterium]|nr:nicotinate-nucleotide--dimethylbenzimidazole phosphoribosyltransferase [Solirubrobacteraceae bacterium]